MEAVYLDTNVLMALLCPEPETDYVIGWFMRSDALDVVSSPWCRTELASALAIKQRTGQLSKKEAELASSKGLAVLASTRCEQFETVDFDEAAVMCALAALNLRGPDALHLAVAKRVGCLRLATMDVVMAKAAKKLGFKVEKIVG
jgi:uncharacterized protein